LSAETNTACSIVNPKLDYCNSLLFKTSNHNAMHLQRVQNNLVRINTSKLWIIMKHIWALHWLRIPKHQHRLQMVKNDS